MKWLKNLFKKEPKKVGNTKEEIEVARQSEPVGYETICQKFLIGRMTGKSIGFSSQDPNMSVLDRMILPHIMTGTMMGMFGGGVVCDESCPGYTPLPVEDFPLIPDGPDVVRCQRFVPKDLLNRFGGWEGLREYAINLPKDRAHK